MSLRSGEGTGEGLRRRTEKEDMTPLGLKGGLHDRRADDEVVVLMIGGNCPDGTKEMNKKWRTLQDFTRISSSQ